MRKNKLLIPITLVIGLGKSGENAARLLKSEGESVIVVEESNNNELAKKAISLRELGITVVLGKAFTINNLKQWINQIRSVIVSPGVSWDHSTLKQLRGMNITVKGEVSLAWERLSNIPWAAITGTNGKTTVTYMLQHICKDSLINSAMCGNMGVTTSSISYNYKRTNKEAIEQLKLLIIEMSSYQIESSPEIKPHIGIWTNLTPDHLERHKTIENYFKIKSNLLNNSLNPIYNADDKYLANHRNILKEGIWVSTKSEYSGENKNKYWLNKEGVIMEDDQKLYNSNLIKIPGEHNVQNLLLVTAAARLIGITSKDIEKSIVNFKGVPHRLEKIDTPIEIDIFNDSKATNYDSAIAGISSVEEPIILISGGKGKKGDIKSWLRIVRDKVSSILLYGSSAKFLEGELRKTSFSGEIEIHIELEEAVKSAIKLIKYGKSKTLLFSPSCASFDQYRNFEERGEHFKALIKRYANRI